MWNSFTPWYLCKFIDIAVLEISVYKCDSHGHNIQIRSVCQKSPFVTAISFFSKFSGHQFFCGATNIPRFGLRVMSPLGFKARVDPLTCLHLHYLRFTSGVTPVDLLAVSMAAELFWSTYLRTSIGRTRVYRAAASQRDTAIFYII